VQFDGRLGGRRLQHLYIGGDVNGLDIGQHADLVLLDPGEEVTRGPVIGHARVLVAELNAWLQIISVANHALRPTQGLGSSFDRPL
jgi:hypothetical protein